MGYVVILPLLRAIFPLRGKIPGGSATSSVGKWHILGPKSHVSMAILVGLLLAVVIEILDCECRPVRHNFAVFAIQGHVRNTTSPCGKGPSNRKVRILVAYDQGSNASTLPCWSSGNAGVIQLTVRAMMPNFAPHAAFCTPCCLSSPLCDHPLGEQQAASMTASQSRIHGTKRDIKASKSRLGSARLQRLPTLVGRPIRANLPIFTS